MSISVGSILPFVDEVSLLECLRLLPVEVIQPLLHKHFSCIVGRNFRVNQLINYGGDSCLPNAVPCEPIDVNCLQTGIGQMERRTSGDLIINAYKGVPVRHKHASIFFLKRNDS